MSQKLYVIRKYVVALSVEDAIQQERGVLPDEVYLDSNTLKEHLEDVLAVHATRPGFDTSEPFRPATDPYFEDVPMPPKRQKKSL